MREVHYPVHSPEELNGEIKFGAFSTPHMKNIMKHFGKPAFARSSACMEFEAFLKRIKAKGKTCLEIGTYHGVTAVILSQYFDQVVCVSVDNDPDKLLKHQIVATLGIENIIFHDAQDNEEKANIINGLQFDFAYSDGDHTHDARSDFDLVKRCGKVLFHEAWPLSAPVWNICNELPKEEIIWADYDCFAYWQRNG